MFKDEVAEVQETILLSNKRLCQLLPPHFPSMLSFEQLLPAFKSRSCRLKKPQRVSVGYWYKNSLRNGTTQTWSSDKYSDPGQSFKEEERQDEKVSGQRQIKKLKREGLAHTPC